MVNKGAQRCAKAKGGAGMRMIGKDFRWQGFAAILRLSGGEWEWCLLGSLPSCHGCFPY